MSVDRGVEFRILGPLEVGASGRQVALAGTRTRKFLASLLLNTNRFTPYERISEALWDNPPVTARAQIFTAASTLRKAVAAFSGDVDLATINGGYRLTVMSDRLDLCAFRAGTRAADEADAAGRLEEAILHLRDALALWRGTPLSGLADNRYLMEATSHLVEERMKAIERFMVLRLRRGESASLLAELTGLVAEFPLQESLRAALMAALYNAGRQADSLILYDRTRRMLADEFGIDPDPRLRKLHQVVLDGRTSAIDDLGNPLVISAEHDSTAVTVPTPARLTGGGDRCYLPRAVGDFTGRAGEVQLLLRTAAEDEPRALIVSPIDGMGGVGKTTLAVHVAHQLIDRYPDGQFFVDMHGFSDGVVPLTPAQGLDLLLQEAGVAPELVPSDLDQRSALWRSETAGKRALVLLDNVSDVAQVRSLLPGASQVLVIVTSRRRLTALESAVPLALDVLTHDEAVELFTRIVGAARVTGEEEAVAEAVELCGRLPLAVSIAAARLRDRVSWTMSYLVEQLGSQQLRRRILATGDRNVLAVLSVSYRYLDEDGQRLLRLLSLHPGPDFDPYAAAAVADLPVDRAADVLERLFEDNLLLQQTAGRYRFHDLVRDCSHYLREQTDSAEECERVWNRLLDYYLQSAHAWCQPMARGPFRFALDSRGSPQVLRRPRSDLEALDHMKTEYRNLVALARFAISEGRHDHAWQLVCSIQPFLKQLNYRGDALELFEGALDSARATGNQRAESTCLTGIGLILRERQLNSAASTALEKAIAISQETSNKATEIYQLTDLGAVKLNEFKTAEAYELFRRSRALAEEVGDELALATLENNLGLVCDEMGWPGEAIRHFDRAMAFYEKTGDDRSVTLTQVNMGVSLCREGRFADAVKCLDEGLRLSRAHGIVRARGWALAALCVALRAVGSIERAMTCGREALAIARDAKIIDVECEALAGLGETFLALDDLDRAEKVYKNAEHVAAEHGLPLPAARAHEGYAHITLARRDEAMARQNWEQAVRLYPANAAESRNASIHLAAMDANVAAQCLRCARGDASMRSQIQQESP